jgi:anti-sigma regulatory factor (Ser/Thr protein kinase)
MVTVRSRGEKIRSFILKNVEKFPNEIARKVADAFEISRQAANKHLQHLVDEKVLFHEGKTRNRTYKLCPLAQLEKTYPLTQPLEEDVVWRNDMRPFLGQLPENVVEIWNYGFTEMLNNAIDHSEATEVVVYARKTATSSEAWIVDNGVGIFKKIQHALSLLDERHAVLELSKGKLTTDPSRHTGEGIFFTSRMFDEFVIMSSGTHFSHQHGQEEDWILERPVPTTGTAVLMGLNNHTARTLNKIFNEYTSGEIGFTKTVVPVRLAQYGNDKLVSRSQAKRLLDRVDRFKTVLIDFKEVSSIGQAFADEIFRVFRNSHPGIDLYAINTNSGIQDMITRAQSTNLTPATGALTIAGETPNSGQ